MTTTHTTTPVRFDGDDFRETTKLVRSLPADTRAEVARMFIGFVCEVTHELVSGQADTARTNVLAVEGVAQQLGGSYSHQLITTPAGDMHDLSRMTAIPLPTIRSIRTLRRF